MVTSCTAPASSPPRTSRPSTPTEKSPLTGLTPECTPVTDWTNKPVPYSRKDSALVERPGAIDTARQPADGVVA